MTPTPPTVPLMRVIRRLCWFYPLAHATREHGVKVRRTQRRHASASATRVKFLGESFLWCLNARMRVSCAPAQSLTHALRVCIMVARIEGDPVESPQSGAAQHREHTHACIQPTQPSSQSTWTQGRRAAGMCVGYCVCMACARARGGNSTHARTPMVTANGALPNPSSWNSALSAHRKCTKRLNCITHMYTNWHNLRIQMSHRNIDIAWIKSNWSLREIQISYIF